MEWIIALVICCWLCWNTSSNLRKLSENDSAKSAIKWAFAHWWRKS